MYFVLRIFRYIFTEKLDRKYSYIYIYFFLQYVVEGNRSVCGSRILKSGIELCVITCFDFICLCMYYKIRERSGIEEGGIRSELKLDSYCLLLLARNHSSLGVPGAKT